MKNEDIKLIKTDSGTDWEAYQVVKTDTARWVEDDIYSQIATSTGDGEVRPNDSRNQKELPSDIINPYSEYGKGFYEGYKQEQERIIEILEVNKGKYVKFNELIDFIIKKIREDKNGI